MNPGDAAQIRELKEQVKWLTRAVIFMAAVLAINSGLLPIALGTLFGLMLILPILAFTHHLIPPVAQQIGKILSWLIPKNQTAR